MREIKFRAWDKIHKKMWSHEKINIWDNFLKDDMSNQYSPLMQYTGLKDKNGKEIYEGDICISDKSIIQIVWSDRHQWGCKILKGSILTLGLEFPLWHWDNCGRNGYRMLEVIGSIYENPELMEMKGNEENISTKTRV